MNGRASRMLKSAERPSCRFIVSRATGLPTRSLRPRDANHVPSAVPRPMRTVATATVRNIHVLGLRAMTADSASPELEPFA